MTEPRRSDQLRDFMRRAGWHDADLSPLAGDASFRRYYRLRRGAQTAVIMDAPPPQEDVRPFITVGRHLGDLGLSPPDIFFEDPDHGFLLLEDLGDDTFATILQLKSPPPGGDETSLYALATDVLVALHTAGARALLPGLSAYAGEPLIEAAMLLPQWYLPAVQDRAVAADDLDSYRAAWRDVLVAMPAPPDTLLLRDFHKDNLMWLPRRSGIRACGLLDFQDAQRGHAAYDLMSLIEDARRDIDPALRAAMIDRYLVDTGTRDRAGFEAAFAILGAQRHARVIGLFVRLLRRDGKPTYLPHLPRVWRLLERSLAHEALTPLRRWVDGHLPPGKRAFAT